MIFYYTKLTFRHTKIHNLSAFLVSDYFLFIYNKKRLLLRDKSTSFSYGRQYAYQTREARELFCRNATICG